MAAVDVPFSFVDRALYLPDAEALVLADLHLGRAVTSAVDAPLSATADVVSRLESLLERLDPGTVVVAGDLLHSFSSLPRGVEDAVADLERAVDDAGTALVVTPGNHDAMLEAAFDGETADEYRLDDGTVVLHGHDEPTLGAQRYVIGHDHPALSVDGRKLPCLLYGPDCYRGTDVLVLPAFTRLAPGSTVNGLSGRDFLSPLVSDPDAFYPAVRDESGDETLWFPPLGECRQLL
ncbi:metallophosphoesterase [Natronobeatus ordinarius]|uniref:metallophosphoesterase n=1 Tax=Natronobeatus ordinarius TaxID=2963433 RepID=UPI0020CC6D5A|nr:metallophosphoesterase [Natronobeatus ordinarius]